MQLTRRMTFPRVGNVEITDPFWSNWQKIASEKTLYAVYNQCESTGRIENFRRVARGEHGTHEGYIYNDSDVYKWIEACAYSLAKRPDDKLAEILEGVVTAIESAQDESGYINTHFQLNHPDLKLQELSAMHEIYCLGHLIEAAVAMKECLNHDRFFQVGIRVADHLCETFGEGKRRGYCGHQEVELALMRLFNLTGEPRYRELSSFMIEQRGVRPTVFQEALDSPAAQLLSKNYKNLLVVEGEYSGEYCQDHAPIREHTKIVGHAVRAMYMYIAATELAADQNDHEMEKMLERVWNNLTQKRIYITGGLGPSASNEGFTTDYDLPNSTSYAETCAAIGLFFWAAKLLEFTGDSRFADMMELTLYNGILAGISLSGDLFFYANPLESHGNHVRVPWYNCACCPPNISRLLTSLGTYCVSTTHSPNGVSDLWIHLPVALKFEQEGVHFEVESDYPWAGGIRVVCHTDTDRELALRIRMPEFCDNVSVDTPDDEEANFENGYIVLQRKWKAGEVFRLDFEISPKWYRANPFVQGLQQHVALKYGPVVYCVERELNTPPMSLLMVDPAVEATLQKRIAKWYGATNLTAKGAQLESWPEDLLYSDGMEMKSTEQDVEFIPYFAWNNSGKSQMKVWFLAQDLNNLDS